MKKVVALSALVIVIISIIAISYIFIRSNAIIYKKYNIPLVDVIIPKDPASLAAGKKIALTRGCLGCHKSNLSGGVYLDWEAGMVAANISKVIPQYSDEELFRLIKHGIKKDGTGVWAMPAGMFANLTKKDISQLIAFLRTVPAVENKLPTTYFSFKGRMQILKGEIKPEAPIANPNAVKDFHYPDSPSVVQQGNYLALTTCTECHGYDLKGAYGNPPLIIARAYREEEFVRLLKTGRAMGNRELILMSDVCRRRFTHYSEDEIKSIYAFLKQME